MSKEYFTVSEVAREFSVTKAAVRDWIGKRKLLAIQPSGERGAYRIPAAALEVFRSRSTKVRRATRPPQVGRKVDLYAERIVPVLRETGLSADDLLRRMATDRALVARYPSFASDYAAFVRSAARAAMVAASAAHA
jgi:excisionase family DNA binding protein